MTLRALLLAIIWAAVGCQEGAPSEDAGALVGPSFDAGRSVDAMAVVDASATADAAIESDAGPVPCAPECDGSEQCIDQRCLRACPCAAGERCEPGSGFCLPNSCINDSSCPPRFGCLQRRCVRMNRPCLVNSECAEGALCSAARECTRDECISHTDCGALERCAQRRCLNRVASDPRVLFERVREDDLEAHFSALPGEKVDRHEEPDGQYGYGGALFDYDGDLDLDVFVGSQTQDQGTASSGCLFRNDSVPGEIRFRRIEEHCGWRDPALYGAFALDLRSDGFHELLLVGERRLILQQFHPEESQTNLLSLIEFGDPRRSCMPGSALHIDVDYDGRLDLYVGCQLHGNELDRNALYNILFLQNADGSFRLAERWSDYPLLLETQGSTLALGAADLDDDGLLDLMVSQDSIMLPGEVFQDPGGVYIRCSPTQDCVFRPYTLEQGMDAFRNLMGSAVVQIENQGEFLYFTDVDTNQLIQVTGQPATNLSLDYGLGIERRGTMVELYSWGIAVDDFDRDGRDDLFVGRGSVIPHESYDFAMHHDALLLQQPDGRFVMHSDEVGITPFSIDDTGHESFVYSSRAVLKADLDYDGHLDLFGMGMEGPPRLHREVPLQPITPDRCTLVPVPRYAPGFGVGYQLTPPGGVARKWDSQGQIRSSASPFIVSPWQRGSIRFPSGSPLAFDCEGRTGPVVLVEPEWLTLTPADDGLGITALAGRPEGALTVLVRPEMTTHEVEELGSGRARVVLPAGTTEVMLRFGDRWLPRWFAL